MRAVKLGYAIKDGRLVSVTSVPLGATCNCVCPKCGDPVVAKNRDFASRVTQMHFSHAKNAECAVRGGETAPETALHLLAKDILVDGLRIAIPGLLLFPEAKQTEFRQLFPAKRIKFRSATKEPWRPAVQSGLDMRPDVSGITEKGQEIHVEFRVAHPVPPEKSDAAQKEQRWMVEIDLARFRGDTFNVDELREFIQQSSLDRAWLSRGPGFDLKERLLKASGTPTECPLGLPRAIENGTCRTCPCRLSSPDDLTPMSIRCTGRSRVTSKATLEAWERGEAVAVPSFATAMLSAARRKERAEQQRKDLIDDIRQQIRDADGRRLARENDWKRLEGLLADIMKADARLKLSRRTLEGVVQSIDTRAIFRANSRKGALHSIRVKMGAGGRRLKELQEVAAAKDRVRRFNQSVMSDYLAGRRPVLCPHCSQPARGRIKNGQLESVERCDCLIPDHERTPTPVVWAMERRLRFVNERIKEL